MKYLYEIVVVTLVVYVAGVVGILIGLAVT